MLTCVPDLQARRNTLTWKKKKAPHRAGLSFWAPPLGLNARLENPFEHKEVVFLKLFAHCNEFESFFSNLEIVTPDLFKAALFVETDSSFVAVKNRKPHVTKAQVLGFFQKSILKPKPNFHGQKVLQNVDFLELTNVL